MRIIVFEERIENKVLSGYFLGNNYERKVDDCTGDICFTVFSQEENICAPHFQTLDNFYEDNHEYIENNTNLVVILSLSLVEHSYLQDRDEVYKILSACFKNEQLSSSTVFAIYSVDGSVEGNDIISKFVSLVHKNYFKIENLEQKIEKLKVFPLNPETRDSYKNIVGQLTIRCPDVVLKPSINMMHYFFGVNGIHSVFNNSLRAYMFQDPHLALSMLVGFMYYYKAAAEINSENLFNYKTFFETAGLAVVTKIAMDSINFRGNIEKGFNALYGFIDASTKYNHKFYEILVSVQSVVSITEELVLKAKEQKEVEELVSKYSELGDRVYQTLDDLHENFDTLMQHADSFGDSSNKLIIFAQNFLSRISKDFSRTTRNFDRCVSEISSDLNQMGHVTKGIGTDVHKVTGAVVEVGDNFEDMGQSMKHGIRTFNESVKEGVKVRHKFCSIL